MNILNTALHLASTSSFYCESWVYDLHIHKEMVIPMIETDYSEVLILLRDLYLLNHRGWESHSEDMKRLSHLMRNGLDKIADHYSK